MGATWQNLPQNSAVVRVRERERGEMGPLGNGGIKKSEKGHRCVRSQVRG